MGVKISQLTPALSVTADDLIEVVQGGVSLRITASMLGNLLLPAGIVQTFAGTVVPDGWFLCDGTSKVKANYARLYAAIGNTFGSDTTTFKVPDLRGRFVRGYDDGRGVDSGRVFGSDQSDLFKAHSHSELAKATVALAEAGNDYFVWYGDGSTSTGSAGGVETRPTNVALNYIIKY